MNRPEQVSAVRQVRLERRLPAYWRVTFDIPPLNIFGPETIPQLDEIITALQTDEQVKVVVFDSAVEGFFLTHYNFPGAARGVDADTAGQDGLAGASGYAGTPQPGARGLHRIDSRPCDRGRQ